MKRHVHLRKLGQIPVLGQAQEPLLHLIKLLQLLRGDPLTGQTDGQLLHTFSDFQHIIQVTLCDRSHFCPFSGSHDYQALQLQLQENGSGDLALAQCLTGLLCCRLVIKESEDRRTAAAHHGIDCAVVLHMLFDLFDHRVCRNCHALKNISHMFGNPVQIVPLEPLQHSVYLRMLHDLRCIQLLIDKFRGHADRRLPNEHVAVRTGRQSTQLLSDSLCKRSAPKQAVRNIRTDFHAPLHKLPHSKPQSEQSVHSDHGSGGIRTPACHAGSDRYEFLQIHSYPLLHFELIHQKLRCFIDQIVLVRGNKRKICSNGNPRFLFDINF